MKNSFLRLLPLLILSWPARVFACAVCMGAPGSAVVDATNGFIFAMLGFLGVLLVGGLITVPRLLAVPVDATVTELGTDMPGTMLMIRMK